MTANSTFTCTVLVTCIIYCSHAQARPCVEGVCLGDPINAVNGFSYEPVESFGRPLSPRKKQKLDAIYPRYPDQLAMPLLQGRFDNRILTALPTVNKACSPRSMIGRTIKRSGIQTQFTLQLDTTGNWKVVAIAQIFPPASRDGLRKLNMELDTKYKDYSANVPNRVADYLFVPNPGVPYFLLSAPMPDHKTMEKYRQNCL